MRRVIHGGAARRSRAGGARRVDNPCAKPEEFKAGLLCLSSPSAHETTLRSAFSDTDHSWQVAAGESGTCTRRLRISRPKRLTISALGSSPRVRLRSTTNTQGSPSYRLTILPSQNASTHVPGDTDQTSWFSVQGTVWSKLLRHQRVFLSLRRDCRTARRCCSHTCDHTRRQAPTSTRPDARRSHQNDLFLRFL